MNTQTDKQTMIQTLENIELLASAGRMGNPLTALEARLLRLEISDSETELDALERAEAFVITCKQEAA